MLAVASKSTVFPDHAKVAFTRLLKDNVIKTPYTIVQHWRRKQPLVLVFPRSAVLVTQ